MAEEKELNPFTDIPYASLPLGTGDQNDAMFFSDLRSLQVGQGGNNIFRVDKSGIWLGGKTFDVATFSVSMTGVVVATSITITGGTIKYGKTSFADSVNAGYFISALGFYFGSALDATKIKYTVADGTIDHIGTISGRSTAILAAAISATGHFIDDRLDTSAKQILGGFSFGVSGAIQIGTYSPGVSGDIRITPNGIVGRNSSNATTLSIDATTGNAYFAGELSAAYGTLGALTGGTLTGTIFQTAVSGNNRILISSALGIVAKRSSDDAVIGGFQPFVVGGNVFSASLSKDAKFLYLRNENTTSTATLVYLDHDGLGGGIDLIIANASNTNTALNISHAGTGSTAVFAGSNTTGVVVINPSGSGVGLKINQSGGLGCVISGSSSTLLSLAITGAADNYNVLELSNNRQCLASMVSAGIGTGIGFNLQTAGTEETLRITNHNNSRTVALLNILTSSNITAPVHLPSYSANPTGQAYVGDVAVVSGILKICTTSGNPGTWTTVGTQT